MVLINLLMRVFFVNNNVHSFYNSLKLSKHGNGKLGIAITNLIKREWSF